MINLPLSESSPLVAWPPNVKQNVYCEILKLANTEAKEVLSFLCQIMLPSKGQALWSRRCHSGGRHLQYSGTHCVQKPEWIGKAEKCPASD